MKKRLALALPVSILVFALVVPSASAAKPSSSSDRTFGPASSLRGTRGIADQTPYGYFALHAKEYALAKAAANAKAPGGGRGKPPKGGGGTTTVTTYPEVSPSFNGTYQTDLAPPDTTGAVGPDRYIEAINTKFAIYSKSGSLIGSDSLTNLTGISGGLFGYNLSDPQFMWDQKTQRFYFATVYFDPFFSDNGIALGWSTTATPTGSGSFCKYVATFGAELPDYPKLGDSEDFLLYGYNMFQIDPFFGTEQYDGSEIMTLNKPPAGSTCPGVSGFKLHYSGVLHNADSSQTATPVPAHLVDDSNGAGYVVGNADLTVDPYKTNGAAFASVFSVTTSGQTDANGVIIPTFAGPNSVAVSNYTIPQNAAQRGSSYLIDTLDGRFEAAVAAVDPTPGRGVAIWTAHAVFGGAGAEERWYEINPAGSLYDSGVASSSSLYIHNGAISPDRNGSGSFGNSWAMSVSTSSSTTYPAIALEWHKAGSATTPTLKTLVQSGGPNVDFTCNYNGSGSPCRWGDYSGATPDPAATGTVGRVWLDNQYNVASSDSSGTDWRTWVFAVTPS
jgi:hypothetical protein